MLLPEINSADSHCVIPVRVCVRVEATGDFTSELESLTLYIIHERIISLFWFLSARSLRTFERFTDISATTRLPCVPSKTGGRTAAWDLYGNRGIKAFTLPL